MTLRARIPVEQELRLKAFLYGLPGAGKTLAALQFPNAYIIDTAKETTRYAKLIKKQNSKVFECSNPFDILNELYALRDTKHNFKTIVIDEITTLYQNLQAIWTDRFIEAAEKDNSKNSKNVLLQDFGFRYWDKVKRDWRRIIDALRNLDMNVIVNAHQKDKYGSNQAVIGITSDSEKSDEHAFDFVFRLIIKGKDFKAITEKQRVLPIELDPDSKQFPREFFWNYDNLLKFYHKEYLENESLKTTNTFSNNDNGKITNGIIDKIKQHDYNEKQKKIIDINNEDNNTSLSDIDKIKLLLKENNIKKINFKIFLREVCKWTYVKKLNTLKKSDQKAILKEWSKIKKEYLKFAFPNVDSNKKDTIISDSTINEVKSKMEQNKTLNKFEPSKPIREDQKEILIRKFEENDLPIEMFFSGFSIKRWEEINQEGANNMIKNFETMLGGLEE